MERIMIVQSVSDDGTARVCAPQKGKCKKGCDGCAESGRDKSRVAQNAIGAKPGDRVCVTMRKVSAVKAAVFLYVVPVLLFLAGYILGEKLWGQGPLAGMGGLFLALVLATVHDRMILKKKPNTYTITGFAPKA